MDGVKELLLPKCKHKNNIKASRGNGLKNKGCFGRAKNSKRSAVALPAA